MIVNCSAEIKRLVYQNNVAKGKEMIACYPWYLTAVNENSELMKDGRFWKLFKLSIMDFVDIKESDSVVINSVEYSVKWIAERVGWGLVLTTVVLEKWQ